MKKRHKTKWSFLRINIFIITLAGAGFVVGHVIFSNLPLSGSLSTLAIPGEPSPFFGGFRPESRIVVVKSEYAELKEEPIYFGMAVPPFFRSAIVRMEYRNLGQPVIELGARSSLDEWVFVLKPIEADINNLDGLPLRDSFFTELAETSKPKQTTDGWSISETQFDFGPLAVDAHGDLQMVVSLPGIKTHKGSVMIRNIQIEYLRPALTLDYLVEMFRKRITL